MGRPNGPPLASDAVRNARLNLDMTQEQVVKALADHDLEIDQGHYSRIETNQVRRPSRRTVRILAEVLGVDLGKLYDREDKAA